MTWRFYIVQCLIHGNQTPGWNTYIGYLGTQSPWEVMNKHFRSARHHWTAGLWATSPISQIMLQVSSVKPRQHIYEYLRMSWKRIRRELGDGFRISCRTDLLPYVLYNSIETGLFQNAGWSCAIKATAIAMHYFSGAPSLTEAAHKYVKHFRFICISGKGPQKILIHNPLPFSVGTEKGPACNVRLMSAKACSKETFVYV